MTDLVKRLRATEGLPDGYGNFSRLRNPDGLEAADRIEQLEEALEKEKHNTAWEEARADALWDELQEVRGQKRSKRVEDEPKD